MKKLARILGIAGLLSLMMVGQGLALTVTLSWSDNSNNEDGFKVYRSTGISQPFAEIGTTGVDGNTFVDPNGAAGSCYRVTAFNVEHESQPSNNACLLLVVPASPGPVKLEIQ